MCLLRTYSQGASGLLREDSGAQLRTSRALHVPGIFHICQLNKVLSSSSKNDKAPSLTDWIGCIHGRMQEAVAGLNFTRAWKA